MPDEYILEKPKSERVLARPGPSVYAAYYGGYVDRVGEGNVLKLLSTQRDKTVQALASHDDENANHAYAPNKWTIKEVMGHVVDVERVFAYRALCFVRRDPASQSGFDQNGYVAAAGFSGRVLERHPRRVLTSTGCQRCALPELFGRRVASAEGSQRSRVHGAVDPIHPRRSRAASRGSDR
jgi:hypothetical protein